VIARRRLKSGHPPLGFPGCAERAWDDGADRRNTSWAGRAGRCAS